MTDGYYQCDRCGEFERGPQRRSRSLTTDFSDEKYRKITYGHRTGEDNSGSLSQAVDLCESCRKELTEWIEGEEP